MTTATRRLRRASIAGLATVATVGGMILATGGTAFAAEVAVTDAINGTATTVYPGANGQSTAGLTVTVAAGTAINANDTITITLGGGSCVSNAETVTFNALPTATSTVSGGDTNPNFAGSLSAVGCAAGNNTLTLKAGAADTNANGLTVAVTGVQVNVASSVANGTSLTLTPSGVGGSAVAVATTSANGSDKVDGTPTTVYPGVTGQAVASLQVNQPNVFSIGQTITVVLGGGNCGTTNGAVGFAATPTITVKGPFTTPFGAAAGSASDTTPTFTSALSSSAGACTTAGVKDTLTITLTNSSNGSATDDYYFEISGITVNVGSAVGTGNVTLNGLAVGTVANTKLSVSKVIATTPGSTNVAIGDVTAADVSSSHITSPVAFTLTGAVWNANTAPTMSGPSGITWTFAGKGTATLTATASAALPTTSANTLTLSGATIDPTGAGVVSLAASYNGGTPIGSSVKVAAVAAESWTGGVDRYATAAQLFDSKFSGSGTAVLVSGANFPDALSAANLASRLGTGVLLTDPNSLSGAAENAIITDHVTTVYIVGGTAAVSDSVANSLKGMHEANDPTWPFINVVRVSGGDRYATAEAVNLYSDSNTGSVATGGTAVVATGENFADALAVGPAAWSQGYPVVLTTGSTLDASAQATLTSLGVTKVIIVGGVAAVSSNVETQIKGLGITIAYRVAGSDRTQTAAQIATWEHAGLSATSSYSALPSLGWGITSVNISRGDNFADALAAGPVEGFNHQVILLTSNPTTLGAGISSFVAGQTVTAVNALGLTAAVSTATMAAAVAAIAG